MWEAPQCVDSQDILYTRHRECTSPEPCRGDVRPIDGYPPSPLQGSLADHTFNPGAHHRPRLLNITPSGFWTPYRQEFTCSPTSFQGSSPSFLPWREPVFQCVKDVMGMNTSARRFRRAAHRGPTCSHQVVTKRRRLHLRNEDRAGLTRRTRGSPRKRTVRYAEEDDRMQHSQDGSLRRCSRPGVR